jgi:hypothetical protein
MIVPRFADDLSICALYTVAGMRSELQSLIATSASRVSDASPVELLGAQ